MSEKQTEKLTIDIGSQDRDYQVGNFLTALDELCCTMFVTREITDAEMADALDLYAKRLRRDNSNV